MKIMLPIVMKFGGASLKTPQNICLVAKLIAERSLLNPYLVVVVSAMGNTTDQLLELAKEVHDQPPHRELDMLVSVGERVSMALLAMALLAQGVEAISFTGSQSGILTSEDHSDAKIVEIRPARIKKALQEKKIVIVAGFQGMSRSGEITTLGRGGSDTTAVALAATLGAHTVEFYKDVGAVFDQDPKKNEAATLLAELSFSEAKKLAEGGAKVLHPRCIQLAEKNGIQLHVRSLSMQPYDLPGSIVGAHVVREAGCILE